MITFDKFVSKLMKSSHGVIHYHEMAKIIDPDYGNNLTKPSTRIYNYIYRLKSTGGLEQIGNGIYVLKRSGDEYSPTPSLDDLYWKMVAKTISVECQGRYVLGGYHSMAMSLKDFSMNTDLVVYTKDFAKTIILAKGYRIVFRSYDAFLQKKKVSFSSFLSRYAKKISYDGSDFMIMCPELALLDTLKGSKSLPADQGLLFGRYLQKHHAALSRAILGDLVRIKYISSINRLRKLSKEKGYDALYAHCLSIINDEGHGCFLSV